MEHVIELQAVGKSYPTPAGSVEALKDIDLRIEPAELVAVHGRSGSGKSTLLNMIAGIDTPTIGTVTVHGTLLRGLTHDGLARWRGRTVGVVFQFFQLLPMLTVEENVLLPMDFCGCFDRHTRPRRARDLLDRVGVADQARKLPATLSGGQQQRVAIARALANDPPIIVADEPTGNLDSETAAQVLGLFADLSRAGRTVVIVTHEREGLDGASRAVTITDGRLQAHLAMRLV